MEDKTFELLTKMYSEFSSKIDNMQGKIENIQTEMTDFRNDITQRKFFRKCCYQNGE